MARLYLLLLLTAGGLQAEGFNCSKAITPQERAICASPLLSSIDSQMAAAYKEALAAVPPEVRTRIQQDQRQWLSKRDTICPASHDAESDSAMSDCLQGYENRRADLLRHLVQRKNGVLFVWRSITLSFHPAQDSDAGVDGYFTTEAGSVLASWPQAISPSSEWQAWNRGIERAARRMACGNSENKNVQAAWSSVCAKDAMNTISVTIDCVDEHLVAAEIDREWFDRSDGSSATDSLEFNWLFDEKRELRADDIFETGTAWRKVLLAAARKTLEENPLFENGRLSAIETKTILNPEHWSLGADALSIPLPSAYAPCHACDSPAVTIRWEQLKPYLKPAFPRAKESALETETGP